MAKDATAKKPAKASSKPTKEAPAKPEAVAADPVDLLMWVGTSNYRSISDFVREARELGVCKRISKVPNDLVFGKSRLFLAHDEGCTGDAVIFGYATIERVECLVAHGKELDPELVAKGVVAVDMDTLSDEAERGCGNRTKEGALYVRGSVHVFQKPVDYNAVIEIGGTRFRGMKKVDGAVIASKDAPRKECPLDRVPTYTGLPKAERKAKWTDEEVNAAVALVVDKGMTTTQAIKVMARETGRGEQSVNYKFYHGEKSIKKLIAEKLAKKGKGRASDPVEDDDVTSID